MVGEAAPAGALVGVPGDVGGVEGVDGGGPAGDGGAFDEAAGGGALVRGLAAVLLPTPAASTPFTVWVPGRVCPAIQAPGNGIQVGLLGAVESTVN